MKIKNTYIEVKKRNMSTPVNTEEIYRLIKRVANETYAEKIVLELAEDDGFDFYELYDKDGKIIIRSGSGVGFASGLTLILRSAADTV